MRPKQIAEKRLVDKIIKIGIAKLWEMDGEGRKRNNTYYQIELKDGSFVYWANFSEENLKIIKGLS